MDGTRHRGAEQNALERTKDWHERLRAASARCQSAQRAGSALCWPSSCVHDLDQARRPNNHMHGRAFLRKHRARRFLATQCLSKRRAQHQTGRSIY